MKLQVGWGEELNKVMTITAATDDDWVQAKVKRGLLDAA